MAEETWDEAEQQQVIDIFKGNLTNVKEERNLLPPTQNVKLRIIEIDNYDVYESGEDRPWMSLRVNFAVEEGIIINEERKYKGSRISAMIPYFASPSKYDYSKPFFAKAQFLVSLKQLVMATGVDSPDLINGGVSPESISKLIEELKGKIVLGNILQTKVQTKNPETGKYEDTEDLQNEVKFFKSVPQDELI